MNRRELEHLKAAYDAAREAGATDIFLRIDPSGTAVRGTKRGNQVFYGRVQQTAAAAITLRTLDGQPLNMNGVDTVEIQMFGSFGKVSK